MCRFITYTHTERHCLPHINKESDLNNDEEQDLNNEPFKLNPSSLSFSVCIASTHKKESKKKTERDETTHNMHYCGLDF